MKKLFILVSVFVLLFSGMAFADCNVTVNWVKSPSAGATNQQVIYDPDSAVAGGEVIKGDNLAMTVTSFTFSIPAPIPNDEVWVRTTDAADYADSSHMPVGGINAATGVQTITICQ